MEMKWTRSSLLVDLGLDAFSSNTCAFYVNKCGGFVRTLECSRIHVSLTWKKNDEIDCKNAVGVDGLYFVDSGSTFKSGGLEVSRMRKVFTILVFLRSSMLGVLQPVSSECVPLLYEMIALLV